MNVFLLENTPNSFKNQLNLYFENQNKNIQILRNNVSFMNTVIKNLQHCTQQIKQITSNYAENGLHHKQLTMQTEKAFKTQPEARKMAQQVKALPSLTTSV